jgi:hypothetical protein
MNLDDIKCLISSAKGKGLSVKIRDIAFVYLRQKIDDDNVCYSALYGTDFNDSELKEYVGSSKIAYLNKELKPKNIIKPKETNPNTITFDENRAGMEEDLRYIDKFIKDNEKDLDPKEIAALMGKKSDLRVKLNDKFGANEQKDEQRIIVMHKSDFICDRQHCECPLDLMYVLNMAKEQGKIKSYEI